MQLAAHWVAAPATHDSAAAVLAAFAGVLGFFAAYGFLGRWLRTKGFRLRGDGGAPLELAWTFFIWAAPGSTTIAVVLGIAALLAR